jgi:hypothetical protein
MKTYRAYDIDWDTDGADIDLPNDALIEIGVDENVAVDGADKLSDMFGWCVNSFSFEETA